MKNLLRPLCLTLLLFTLVAAGSQHLRPGVVYAGPPLLFDVPLEGEGPWVVRAYFSDPQMVRDLAAYLEPWEVHPEKGYLVAEVDQAMYLWMQAAGFRMEVDPALTSLLHQPNQLLPDQVNGIPGYPCYRTVEETYASAESIAASYPALATWLDIGDSWEKTYPGGDQGYDLYVLRLTNSQTAGPKPVLFILSGLHAREYATAELSTRFAEYLVASYGVDPDITWLLDFNEIHLLLHANPDGRKKAESGLAWRKNTDNLYCSNSNNRGVDLNRNFDFEWGCCGGSSTNACSETFRGPAAASEPETQTIQNYIRQMYPDQRGDGLNTPAPADAHGLFLDIHSYGQLVLWPWGFTNSDAPNSVAFQTLGRKFAYFNSYEPQQSYELYPTDGTTDDFTYGELGLAGYTFELGTAFFQSCSSFESQIYPDNLPALLYAARSARRPYQTPAGPDALELMVSPNQASPNQPLDLTAVIDDTGYSSLGGVESTQDIASAEYSIDTPPWAAAPDGIFPLLPVDGSFDEKVEQVQATLDTRGLSHGRHTVFVRGRDSTGNWGPLSGVFLYILDSNEAPVIQGFVRDAVTSQPLAAQIRAGNFNTLSDPATGFYSTMVLSGTYELSASTADHITARIPGLQANPRQVLRQDVELIPTCTVLNDSVESGNQGWTASTPWGITGNTSHSPTHSWADSPGGNYANNRNNSLTSPLLNLAGLSGSELVFWHTHDLEAGFDYGHLEYSLDNGVSWQTVSSYSGLASWRQEVVPLPSLDGQANVRLRFRLFSDGSITRDGWFIDDIRLTSGSNQCAPLTLPQAGFIHSTPAYPNQAVQFTNLSYGTPPLSYNWDFGGLGGSDQQDPAFTFPGPGTYAVTLTASSPHGSDSTTIPLTVSPPPVSYLGLVLHR